MEAPPAKNKSKDPHHGLANGTTGDLVTTK